MGERPDKQGRKQLLQQWKAQHPNTLKPLEGLYWLILYGTLGGFLVGAFVGAIALVFKGLVPQLWREGSWLSLVWVVVGAAAGASIVLLWNRFRNGRWERKVGTKIGGILGALIVAPQSILAAIFPTAVVVGGLAFLGTLLAWALIIWTSGGTQPIPSRLAGAILGAYFAIMIWLSFSTMMVVKGALHGDLGLAFQEVLSQLAQDVIGVITLIWALVGAAIGLIFVWRFQAEEGTGKAKEKTPS